MEQKNLCTLTGFIGKISCKTVNKQIYADASLITHFVVKHDSDTPCYDTSLHSVKFKEGKYVSADDLIALKVGSKVSVSGRLINEKYTCANGGERYQPTIIVTALSVLGPKDSSTENRIELIGKVGTVNESFVYDRKSIRLSLATNFIYRNSNDNTCVIETTWHNVNILPGAKLSEETSSRIKTGAPLHIVGKLQYQRFMTSNGETYSTPIIMADEVEIPDPDNPIR